MCVCVCLLSFDQLIQAQRVESRTGQAGQFSIFRRRVTKKVKKKKLQDKSCTEKAKEKKSRYQLKQNKEGKGRFF